MAHSDVSIFTFSLGRELYLSRLVRSVRRAAGEAPDVRVEHHICFQGVRPSEELAGLLAQPGSPNLRIVSHEWAQNAGSAEGMNQIVPVLDGDLLVRLDDDALVVGEHFFGHLLAVHRLRPRSAFCPFPVGLIKNLGGPPADDREVAYSESTDTWYTLRRVSLLGGLARVAPAALIKDWRFVDDLGVGHSGNESAQFAQRCAAAGIAMYYLENALIVEHQESTLGQHARFPTGYFREGDQRRPVAHRLRGMAARWLPPAVADALKARRGA